MTNPDKLITWLMIWTVTNNILALSVVAIALLMPDLGAFLLGLVPSI